MHRLTLYAVGRLRKRSAVIRVTKFGMVGVSGVTLNLLIFSLLTSVLHMHYLIAGFLGIELALCSNYLLNNAWTFADRGTRRPSWVGLGRYHIVATGGTLINLGVLHVLAGQLGLPPLIAFAVAIPSATVWNFALSLGWTWRRPRIRLPVAALNTSVENSIGP